MVIGGRQSVPAGRCPTLLLAHVPSSYHAGEAATTKTWKAGSPSAAATPFFLTLLLLPLVPPFFIGMDPPVENLGPV